MFFRMAENYNARSHPSEIEGGDVRTLRCARVERKAISRPEGRSASRLEAKYDASLYAEIALIVVTARERIAEARENVVGFHRPDGDGFSDRNVHAATDDEIKRIVRGRTDATAAHIANVYVCVGMGAAKHRLRERLDMRDPEFNLGTYVVSEKVAGDGSATGKSPGGAAIALEFGLDPNQAGQKISKGPAATVERKSSEPGNVVVLRIEAHVRIVPGNLHFGIILRKGRRSKQQKKPKKCCACNFHVNLLLILTIQVLPHISQAQPRTRPTLRVRPAQEVNPRLSTSTLSRTELTCLSLDTENGDGLQLSEVTPKLTRKPAKLRARPSLA